MYLVVLSAAHSMGNASDIPQADCPVGTRWTDTSYVRSEVSQPASLIVIERFADAIAVRMVDAAVEKQLVSLEDGMALIKGEGDVIPRDFTGLDMAAGLPLRYLNLRFPSPCDVTGTMKFAVELTAGSGLPGKQMAGMVQRRGSELHYKVRVTGISTELPTEVDFIGRWRYSGGLKNIPGSFSLQGWRYFAPGDKPFIVPENAGITTITALRSYRQALPANP